MVISPELKWFRTWFWLPLETEISCLQNPLILGLCPLQPPFKHRCPVVVKELSNSQKDLQFVKKTPAQVFPCEFCLIFKNNLVLKGLRLNYYLWNKMDRKYRQTMHIFETEKAMQTACRHFSSFNITKLRS